MLASLACQITLRDGSVLGGSEAFPVYAPIFSLKVLPLCVALLSY